MKTVWAVLLVNLLAFGLFCLVVIIHPAEIKAVFQADMSKIAQIAEEQGKKSIPVGIKPTPKPTPPPAATPVKQVEPTVEAEYTGDYANALSDSPPPPELYPLSISRRELLDDGSIIVDILIKNDSGFHFTSPVVVLRSTDYPRNAGFQLPEWRSEEVARFRYKFPQAEVAERLTNLRVRDVRGEVLDSPLSKEIRQQRSRLEKDLLASSDASTSPTQTSEWAQFSILIPDSTAQVPFEMTQKVIAQSEKDRELIDSINSAHQLALEVQEQMMKFVNDINNEGFEESMVKGAGLVLRDEIKSKQTEFSQRVTRILFQKNRNSSSEVDFTPVVDELSSYSQILRDLASLIDSQIPVEKYHIQEQATAGSPKKTTK